jgi:NAD-dependent deacetylase
LSAGYAESCELPEALTARIAGARRWLILTGAGLSADSGVPTFRDAQTGLWARYDAMTLATPEAFEANPSLVWDWYRWRRGLVAAAQPNAGHIAIAEIATLVPELTLVTQNVDGLHQRAGSSAVVEFHGNLARDRCFDCNATARTPASVTTGPPICEACSGRLRPDVVWFGEAIPAAALETAFSAAAAAEIFVAVGTASIVYPAAGLAQLAAAVGAAVVEINPERTPLSAIADHMLEGSAASWLPAIAGFLREAVS